MKKRYNVLLSCFLIIMFTSCAPSKEDAIKYNDLIIDQQTLIVEKINNLYESMNDFEHPEKIEEAYQNAMKQIDKGSETISKMENFGGKSEFREASIKLFVIYKSVVQNEIKGMMEILNIPNTDITPEIESQFDNLNKQALEKMGNGLKEFQVVQYEFAEKYKFKVNKSTK